jgi:hypothetical protein
VAVEDVEGAAASRGVLLSASFGEVGLGLGVVALLDDGDAVQRGVELAVAAAVQAVAAAGFA